MIKRQSFLIIAVFALFALYCKGAAEYQSSVILSQEEKEENETFLACFIHDSKGEFTNIRQLPNGKLVKQLPTDEVYMLTLHTPQKGWWKIVDNHIEVLDSETVILSSPTGEAWIHYSVVGLNLRNYDGQSLALYTEASESSEILFSIEEQEALVRPVDISSDGKWVQVEYEKKRGWIQNEWLCDNPVTTCC